MRMSMDKLSSQSDILELASQFERLRADLRHIEIKGEGVQEVVSAYTPELITIANQLMSATPASPAELWAMAKVALWAQNDEIRHRELEGQTVGPLDLFCKRMLERLDNGFVELLCPPTRTRH
jgi:hypothetical protein